MKDLLQSSTQEPLVFLMVDSTDHITGKTGLTPTVTLSKNGGSFGSPSGAVTEMANGWYKVAGNATDTGTLGPLILHATGTAADPVDERYQVVAVNNQSTAFGLSLAKTTNITGFNDITAQAVWDALTSALTTANSIGKRIVDYLGGGSKVAATVASGDDADAATLLLRLTASRAGYLDNLNVGGVVASHADIAAINQSASKHLLIQTVGQYERPESGSTVYTVEARTFAADTGAAVSADSTPTLTATGQTSGSLAANLSSATNPATGVYRWTYTVSSAATVEPVRFDVSATISSSAFTLSAYTQVVDEVSQTWTSTNATQLAAVYNKLPSGNIGDATEANATTNKAAILTSVSAIPTNPLTSLGSNAPAGWINAASIASGALNGKGDWFLLSSYTAPDNTVIGSIFTEVQKIPRAGQTNTWTNVSHTSTSDTVSIS